MTARGGHHQHLRAVPVQDAAVPGETVQRQRESAGVPTERQPRHWRGGQLGQLVPVQPGDLACAYLRPGERDGEGDPGDLSVSAPELRPHVGWFGADGDRGPPPNPKPRRAPVVACQLECAAREQGDGTIGGSQITQREDAWCSDLAFQRLA
ncbi:hypothetical protein ACFXGI_24905 [Streptomyces sp. NPDC059355]|uniref:hypothetical protein n=1 Tax=Streptomyces sp. NPDC059355 TaxID=3346811 RepID=UPI00367861CA